MRAHRRIRSDPFTDLLFNALMGFTFLFFIAVIFMNPIVTKGNVERKAEYIISVTWQDGSPDDIDLWVQGPQGDLIWYRNKEGGLLHLDRDDRGKLFDATTHNDTTIINELNQEIVTLRGVVPGEYVVNVHYYLSETKEPVEVTVKLERVNPALEVLHYDTVTLERAGAEKTAFRFTLSGNGAMLDLNFLEKQLVSYAPDLPS